MKKIVLWALSTLSVVVLMLGYHTSTSGPLATSAPTSVYSGTTTSSSDTTPTTPASTPSSTSSGSSFGKATSTPSSTPSSSSTSDATTTVTGDTVSTQWGPVQVQLTVSGTTITQVEVLQYPTGQHQDEEINSYALPVLISETLKAQSAHIDAVSGATVTTGGYVGSLQSALDKVGA